MRTIGIILRTMSAVLFLLCILVLHCTAAPNVQPVQDAVHSQEDVEIFTLWSHPSLYVSDHDVAAMFSKREEFTERGIELPSWESIVAAVNDVVKAAEEGLSTIANEFNVTGRIEELESTFNNILAAASEIRGHMTLLTQQDLTLDHISDELDVIFNDILVNLKKAFPPPDQAPSHEERQEMVTFVLDGAEQELLDLARKLGMSEDGLESVRKSFDLLKPHVQQLVVITGDLVEQHPVLLSALVSSVVGMLIPESWFLRPLLRLIGFGPEGPIKGTLAAWVQRTFWGATVEKGSWFSILQKAGMKGKSIRRCVHKDCTRGPL